MTVFTKSIIPDKNMNQIMEDADIENLLKPENELEKAIVSKPKFRLGLLWGVPRYGHPEGQIAKHIAEVYENIEKLDIDEKMRFHLRIIALTHDTFKYAEDKSSPRDWSKHHSILAKDFLSQFSVEKFILDIVELHDEAYYIWRLLELHKQKKKAQKRLDGLLDRLGEYLQLYYLFFKCDTATGDKIPRPVIWFEKYIKGINVIDWD